MDHLLRKQDLKETHKYLTYLLAPLVKSDRRDRTFEYAWFRVEASEDVESKLPRAIHNFIPNSHHSYRIVQDAVRTSLKRPFTFKIQRLSVVVAKRSYKSKDHPEECVGVGIRDHSPAVNLNELTTRASIRIKRRN